jgi:hypothetical protein
MAFYNEDVSSQPHDEGWVLMLVFEVKVVAYHNVG